MFKELVRTAVLWGLLSSSVIAGPAVGLLEDPQVQTFIDEMVDRHQFDRVVLQSIFEQAHVQDGILKAIASPYEAKPWYQYRPLFVTDKHVQRGVEFWKAHKESLDAAEHYYGIPPEMIVAILGIETRYGSNTGNHKVLDALSTLAFKYPPRSKFFRQELEQFLLLVKEEDLDLFDLKGSYAGAIGAPQFIPSSYRHYAVDFSGTGHRDLFHDMDDVIGSVANYFAKHGWEKNKPVAVPVHAMQPLEGLAAPRNNPKPNYKAGELIPQGIDVPKSIRKEQVALIELEGENGPEYWLGAKNFYVITRYNHSSLYGMAAFQLSQEIKKQFDKS
ncbi:MAG: lytic murein transglycosylase B [Legionellales bacterium]|nr:lytic murein transglycosylase B [Legionellales bacterium]